MISMMRDIISNIFFVVLFLIPMKDNTDCGVALLFVFINNHG